jgi:hypothetical protein
MNGRGLAPQPVFCYAHIMTLSPSSVTQKLPHPVVGKWRIMEADMWDKGYLDLVEPAKAIFADPNSKDHSEITFGVVDIGLALDYSQTMIAFTFHGSDEFDEVYGSGWAEVLDDGTLEIEFTFLGDDEAIFKAVRWQEA